MAKNRMVTNMLKFYQQKEKMLVPEMYASFVLALKEVCVENESITEILELTQAFWEESAKKNIDLVKWAEESVPGLDLHTFQTGKAVAGK